MRAQREASSGVSVLGLRDAVATGVDGIERTTGAARWEDACDVPAREGPVWEAPVWDEPVWEEPVWVSEEVGVGW